MNNPNNEATTGGISQGQGGPEYHLDIEGVVHEWDSPTITARQIAKLGGWDVSQGVLEIDKKTNEQRQLQPDEVVELKPGMGFAKKHSWKRGRNIDSRLQQEAALLEKFYPDIKRDDTGFWFNIPAYPIPAGTGWPTELSVAFRAQDGHPAKSPYGIYVPAGSVVNGQKPTNYVEPAQVQPPFDNSWSLLSWTLPSWTPSDDITAGSNLLNFVQTFVNRFKEGA